MGVRELSDLLVRCSSKEYAPLLRGVMITNLGLWLLSRFSSWELIGM